jgi:O-antigen biosynthesis protein
MTIRHHLVNAAHSSARSENDHHQHHLHHDNNVHHVRKNRFIFLIAFIISAYICSFLFFYGTGYRSSLSHSPPIEVPSSDIKPDLEDISPDDPISSSNLISFATLWDMKINRDWDQWSALGYCRNGISLLDVIPNEVCHRVECLYSASLQLNIDLSKLRALSYNNSTATLGVSKANAEYWQDVVWTGNPNQCRIPSGGQRTVSSENDKIETTFIVLLNQHAEQGLYYDGVDALLDIFRTASETKSAEFIVALENERKHMSHSLVTLIENLHHVFGTSVSEISIPHAKSFPQFDESIVRRSSGEFVAIISHDILVLPGWLSVSLYSMRTYPQNDENRVGAVGGMVVNSQGNVLAAGGIVSRDGSARYVGGGHFTPQSFAQLHARPVDFLPFSSVLLRKEAVAKYWPFRGGGSHATPAVSVDNEEMRAAIRRSEDLEARGWISLLQPLSIVVHLNQKLYQRSIPPFNGTQLKDLDTRGHCPSPLSKMAGPIPEYPKSFLLQLSEAATFYRQQRRVLVLEDVVPETDRDAGSIRLFELLHILTELGVSVSFEQQPITGRAIRYVLPLMADGVNMLMPGTLHNMAQGAAHGLFDVIRDLTFKVQHRAETVCPWDLLIIARRDVFERHWADVQRLCPKIPVIFDTVDVHFIRELRMFQTKHTDNQKSKSIGKSKNEPPQSLDLMSMLETDAVVQAEMTQLLSSQRRELSYMRNSNITLVVSTAEQQIIQKAFKNNIDVRVISNIYSVDDAEKDISPAERKGAVFAGNMCHTPNVDAVEFIMHQLLKDPSKLPKDFKMHFVWSRSRMCKHDILVEAEAHPMVEIHRDISNDELLRLHRSVKVVLAPLRYGAGVKGKVNYGLLHGVPVVATRVASEGMGLKSGVNFLLAETGEEFATAIQRLYSDNQLFRNIVMGGKEVMRSIFGRDVAKEKIRKALIDLKLFSKKVGRGKERCPFVDIYENHRAGRWDRYWLTNNNGALYFPMYPRVPYDNPQFLNHIS